MTHGDKLDDRIQAAVARGDAPGVVADLTVVVLTQRGAYETGMPAVCEDVLRAAASAS
jgi:hypothetical protein